MQFSFRANQAQMDLIPKETPLNISQLKILSEYRTPLLKLGAGFYAHIIGFQVLNYAIIGVR